MSLKQQIEDVLEFEDVVVAETIKPHPLTGKDIYNYAINKGGIVLQFAIPVDEVSDPGVVEDFLEAIEASVANLN